MAAGQAALRIEAGAASVCNIHVIGAASREPIAGAAVVADPPRLFGRLYMGNTDAQGRFVLDPMVHDNVRIHQHMAPRVVQLERVPA